MAPSGSPVGIKMGQCQWCSTSFLVMPVARLGKVAGSTDQISTPMTSGRPLTNPYVTRLYKAPLFVRSELMISTDSLYTLWKRWGDSRYRFRNRGRSATKRGCGNTGAT